MLVREPSVAKGSGLWPADAPAAAILAAAELSTRDAITPVCVARDRYLSKERVCATGLRSWGRLTV